MTSSRSSQSSSPHCARTSPEAAPASSADQSATAAATCPGSVGLTRTPAPRFHGSHASAFARVRNPAQPRPSQTTTPAPAAAASSAIRAVPKTRSAAAKSSSGRSSSCLCQRRTRQAQSPLRHRQRAAREDAMRASSARRLALDASEAVPAAICGRGRPRLAAVELAQHRHPPPRGARGIARPRRRCGARWDVAAAN